MKNYFYKGIAATMTFALVAVTAPNIAQAETVIQFQPRTTQELIAYLYGRIVQLQEIQKMIQNGSTQSSSQSLFDYVTVETQKADDITDITAVLRGETWLFGKATAQVWFEYGQDEDFLDFKTKKVSVRSAYDRAARIKVSYLEPDERYYFRLVAQDNKGILIYGSIFSFRTDESDQ